MLAASSRVINMMDSGLSWFGLANCKRVGTEGIRIIEM